MQWNEFKEKAHNGIYKAWWYPRIYLPNCQPILVFTTAKTGTTTLRNTLYRSGIGPVFWAHSMNQKTIIYYRDIMKQNNIKPAFNRLWQDQILKRYIEKDRPLKIISSVRDPIARQVSGFFQRFETFHQTSVNDYADRFDELHELFLEHRQMVHQDGLEWFEREYHEVLGLNVLDHPFPHEQGYQIIKHKQFDILLLRIESTDDTKQRGLSQFLDISDIKLYRANIGSKKNYADTYQKFVSSLKISPDYIDSQYETPIVQHFYTPDEIANFRVKWLNQ